MNSSKVKSSLTLIFYIIITLLIFNIPSECSKKNVLSDSTEKRAEQIKKAIDKIGELMADNYVFPDIGKKAGDHLRKKFKTGKYNQIKDYNSFSIQLTTDLQKITKDRHIRVRKNRMNNGRRQGPPRGEDYGFREYKILSGNIGYIDLRYFASSSELKHMAKKAMKVIENSDAIIYDMRKNGGGSPDGVRYICSYLFDKKTHLNSLYWRSGNRTVEYWTLDKVEGKKRPDVPVFVLTSNRTFSGAEEFTYNLKTRKRAIIIGETTGGGANPGGMFTINSNLSIFISTGRAINPVTKTNWEGIGVEPDIKVSENKAFDIALKKAQKAAIKYKKYK